MQRTTRFTRLALVAGITAAIAVGVSVLAVHSSSAASAATRSAIGYPTATPAATASLGNTTNTGNPAPTGINPVAGGGSLPNTGGAQPASPANTLFPVSLVGVMLLVAGLSFLRICRR